MFYTCDRRLGQPQKQIISCEPMTRFNKTRNISQPIASVVKTRLLTVEVQEQRSIQHARNNCFKSYGTLPRCRFTHNSPLNYQLLTRGSNRLANKMQQCDIPAVYHGTSMSLTPVVQNCLAVRNKSKKCILYTGLPSL